VRSPSGTMKTVGGNFTLSVLHFLVWASALTALGAMILTENSGECGEFCTVVEVERWFYESVVVVGGDRKYRDSFDLA
jgi:hypothetical protein